MYIKLRYSHTENKYYVKKITQIKIKYIGIGLKFKVNNKIIIVSTF